MALKKSEIKPPVLPKETHEVPELGGEIIVRGLLLSERLSLFAEAREGERFSHISRLLACVVVDAEGKPVFTAEEWEQFGSANFEAALRVFEIARRLSGLDAEAREKN